LSDNIYLYQSVANSRWFASTPIILLFSNIDVFRRKLAHASAMRKFYPMYEGGEKDADAALQFFTDWFLGSARNGRNTVVEYTWPKDRKLLEKVERCFEIATSQSRDS